MNKEEWSVRRVEQIQERHARKLAEAEENGYFYYGSDECAWEEAEEEYESLYGRDEENQE